MLFAQPIPTEAGASAEPAPMVSDWITSIGQRVGAWAATCADYYNAAALYDELRGLSDTELQRRGFSRATLARDICQACQGRRAAETQG